MQGFDAFGIEDRRNNNNNRNNNSWSCDMDVTGIVSVVLVFIFWALILFFHGLGGVYCFLIYWAVMGSFYKLLKHFQIPTNVITHHFMWGLFTLNAFVYLFHWLYSLLSGIASPFEIKGDFTQKLSMLDYFLLGLFAILSGLVIEGVKFVFMRWSIANRNLHQVGSILGGVLTLGVNLASGLVMIATLTQNFQNNSLPIVFSLMLLSFVPLQACTSFLIGIGLTERYIFQWEQSWYSTLQLPISITILSQFQKIFLHNSFRDFLEVRKVLISSAIIDFILFGVALTECYFQYTKIKRRVDSQDPSHSLMNHR